MRTTAPIATTFSLLLAWLLGGCGRTVSPSVPVIDLVRRFDRAEHQPARGFDRDVYAAGGVARASIITPVPGRLIFTLPVPANGLFRAFLGLHDNHRPGGGARFRVGISDHRIYEGLAAVSVDDELWTELRVDLSAYAGFQWSLFYRPDRTRWRLVLATDQVGGPGAAVWGTPQILTDAEAARR